MRFSILLSFLIGLTACYGNLGSAKDTGKAALSISDMMRIQHLHRHCISPDGKQVVFVVANADFQRNAYSFTLKIANVENGVTKTLEQGHIDPQPCWSPDGKAIGYLRGDGKMAKLCVLDVADGSTRALAEIPRNAGDLAWSPAGNLVAFLANADSVRKRETPVDTVYEHDGESANSLYLCELQTGKSRVATSEPGHVSVFAWSPDGARIAYVTQPTARKSDSNKTDLWLLTLEGNESHPLVQRPGGDTQPQWSPDGTQIAFYSKQGDEDYFVPYVPCIVPSSGGMARPLVDAAKTTLSYSLAVKPAWSADEKSLYLVAEQGTARHLFEIDLETQDVRQVTPSDGVYGSFSFSSDRGIASFSKVTPKSPADLYAAKVPAFSSAPLVKLNEQLAGRSLGTQRLVHWNGKDGVRIEGLLYLPDENVAKPPYSLVTYLHGGPPTNFLFSFAPEITSGPPQIGFCPIHVLTGRGYAVFCPNPRGSDGYGRAFCEAVKGRWGEIDLNDVQTGIDDLVRQGIADPDRLGLTGYCYGAYLSLRAMTRSDRFKAAFIGGAFGDTAAVYGQTEVPELFEAYFGGPPWEHREAYDRCSPMFDAQRIRTPTFLVHAKMDKRVPWSQSKQLHTILSRVGTPADMVTYPRGDHTVLESRMHAETMRLQVTWFDRWLMPPIAATAEGAQTSWAHRGR